MQNQEILITLDNIGYASGGRAFPGFPKPRGAERSVVEPRGAVMLSMRPGELFKIDLTTGAARACLAVFGDRGEDASAALNLPGDASLSTASFACEELNGWVIAHGGTHTDTITCTEVPPADEPVVLKADATCDVWVINPASATALVDGKGSGAFTVTRNNQNDGLELPPPLGDVVDEIFVPRGTARAYQLRKGQQVQILDIEGQQCSDFQALGRSALDRGVEMMIDGTATRSMVRRSYPAPGTMDKFFDIDMRPMLRVVRDTCGRHDTFGLACTARGYEERGFPGHTNCSDNISAALAP
ncbi:MAG: urea carboxylase-associated family protein, partial [Pseudomonadota bacterium]